MKQENERGIRHRPASFKEKTHHKNVVNLWVTVQQDWMQADAEAAAAHVLRLLHFQFWDVMVAFIFQWGGKSLRSSISEEVNLKHTFILKERNSLNNVRGGLNFMAMIHWQESLIWITYFVWTLALETAHLQLASSQMLHEIWQSTKQ